MAILDIRTGKPLAAPSFTRRKVLGGLAGILATGTAPAAIIRSALAARTVAWSGGGLSAKSYVQDGLVAMWDGIENAGWGTHDASAMVWKDLVGGVGDFLKYYGDGDYSFEADHLRIHKLNFKSSGCLSFSGSVSLECVIAKRATDANSVAAILTIDPWFGINLEMTKVRYSFVRSSDYANDDYLSTPMSYNIAADGTYARFYRGNTLLGTAIGSITRNDNVFIGSSTGSKSGVYDTELRAYNIRLYNRALSAAEIAANYAVDKARFGLT